jgi:hypothetical protein
MQDNRLYVGLGSLVANEYSCQILPLAQISLISFWCDIVELSS